MSTKYLKETIEKLQEASDELDALFVVAVRKGHESRPLLSSWAFADGAKMPLFEILLGQIEKCKIVMLVESREREQQADLLSAIEEHLAECAKHYNPHEPRH